jgi:exopolysaccharide biosynthesis protein
MKLLSAIFISFTVVVGTRFSIAAQTITVTNCQLPGIVCYSEVSTNPPQRLFVAQVDLTNPHLHLRVAPGGPDPDGDGEWVTTLMEPTKVADREHFLLVVNGDFFLAKNTRDAEGTNSHYHAGQWARPEGPAVTDGKTWSTSANARPCLVIHKDHTITIELLATPAADDWEVIGGGPVLVRNGLSVIPPANPAHKREARNPRTVVGLDASGTKLTLLIVDGRKKGVAIGMLFDEMAKEMIRLGCTEAINLDGGGSSVLAVRDAATGNMKILNQPTDGHERAVADVLGIVFDK